MVRTWIVALASLLLTHIFFFEYRPGNRHFEIPYDLKGFHYPLIDYAFQTLREGRFPEWDPTMYSGLPFAANPQVALFYPPTWLLLAANAAKPRIAYQSVQDFMFLHVWLAFMLCFIWMRWRKLSDIAALLGSCIFALSGFMMLQLQHEGLVIGYAWLPLALWGIDQAAQEHRWRPLWKVLVASAFCFLAGYTPFWVVFAIVITVYSACRVRPVRMLAGTVAAVLLSLMLSAVQLIPANEASSLMFRDPRYHGIKRAEFFIPYLVPNYGNFAMDASPVATWGIEYLYLGSAGILGLILLARSRAFVEWAPAAGMLVISVIFLVDPFRIIAPLLAHSMLLSQLIRDWYFLGGISAGASLLAAIGLDRWLRRPGTPAPRWAVTVACVLALAWCIRLFLVWKWGPPEFAHGWASATDAVVALVLITGLGWLFKGSQSTQRMVVATAMLMLVIVEYKAFGTAKRFNAAERNMNVQYRHSEHPWIEQSILTELKSNPEYRIAIDKDTMITTELRHPRLTTPQGFDPLLPDQYRSLIMRHMQFSTDREFDLEPTQEDLLHLFGVRYFISRGGARSLPYLLASDRFRQILPEGYWMKVFEYKHANPIFHWEAPAQGTASKLAWNAEHRVIQTSSSTGGRFRHAEQFYPGWTAKVDGADTKLERCYEAFQCIEIPPGEHRVEFHFQSQSLRVGAVVSALSCLLFAGAMWFTRDRRSSAALQDHRDAAIVP